MFKCKLCGREFKSKSALGGHVSTAHRQTGEDAQAQAASPPAAPVQLPGGLVISDTAEGEAEQIRSYLRDGYTFEQLTDGFGFKETTVRQEMARVIPPEGEKIAEEALTDGIPVTRKAGSGIEVLNPEAVLRRYTDGSPEDEIELRGMMKLRAAMLMVMDLVNIQKEAAEADAKRLKPILDLMKETREEQDAAAARAKASSMDIALEAAHQTALEIGNSIDARVAEISKPAPSEKSIADRMLGPMADVMGQQMSRMFGGMFPGGQEQPPGSPPSLPSERWKYQDKRSEPQQKGGEQ